LTAVTVITTVELDIRSTDIDGDGIVNNAVYFVYFEQVRLAHLMRLGVIWRPRRPGERNFTLAATEAQFLAPLTYPETVVASAWTARVGNTPVSGLSTSSPARATGFRSPGEARSRSGWTRAAGRFRYLRWSGTHLRIPFGSAVTRRPHGFKPHFHLPPGGRARCRKPHTYSFSAARLVDAVGGLAVCRAQQVAGEAPVNSAETPPGQLDRSGILLYKWAENVY
jgi:hypothetical protein